MIDKETAKKQVARLSQFLGFPRGEAGALGELLLAVQSARNEGIAQEAISAFLGTATSDTRCPMPADIRKAIWERQGDDSKRGKCDWCGGSGFRIVHKLVTYRGKSFTIEHSQTLGMEGEAILAFRKKLEENQEILSGAVPCSCLPRSHHAVTGQH